MKRHIHCYRSPSAWPLARPCSSKSRRQHSLPADRSRSRYSLLTDRLQPLMILLRCADPQMHAKHSLSCVGLRERLDPTLRTLHVTLVLQVRLSVYLPLPLQQTRLYKLFADAHVHALTSHAYRSCNLRRRILKLRTGPSLRSAIPYVSSESRALLWPARRTSGAQQRSVADYFL